MSIPESEMPGPRRGSIHQLRGKSLLPWEALVLIVASAGDLIMTYTLLSRHVKFYESNPIAEWFLVHGDIGGLIAFKFGLVAFIVLASETIERHRPRVGRAILLFGIAGALYAVFVGYGLLIKHG